MYTHTYTYMYIFPGDRHHYYPNIIDEAQRNTVTAEDDD